MISHFNSYWTEIEYTYKCVLVCIYKTVQLLTSDIWLVTLTHMVVAHTAFN